MCVVGFAWKAHPDWHLIVAGNRDEFHARPAAPLARWDDHSHVVGGRDLQSGGMWLGVSDEGRFAVVTNIRNPAGPDPAKASRGALVADWLHANTVPELDTLSSFNPFHLFVADMQHAHYLSNDPPHIPQLLRPGIHMLSNDKAGEPWPRKALLQAQLTHWIAAGAKEPRALFDALAIEDWPQGSPGLMPDGTQDHPPVFIKAPHYGTRASTVVAIDKRGRGVIIERSHGPTGDISGQSEVSFQWALAQ